MLAVFITGLLVILATFLLGRTATVRYFLKNVNERSPWNIELAYFNWNLLNSRIEAQDIYILNEENGKEAKVNSLDIHYRPWDFLRGKFYISSLKIEGVALKLPPSQKKKKKLPRLFDVTKLFFLQNIILKEGVIRGVNISLPKDVDLSIDELHLSLRRNILRKTELAVYLTGLSIDREDADLASMAVLTIKANTSMPHWKKEFPYLNDLSGSLKIYDARLEELPIDSLTAKLRYLDDDLKLKHFEVVVGGKALEGKLEANAKDETWSAHIDIPRPISLPYIGKPMRTFDTAGELSGMIEAKGKGFIPSESSGKGQVSLAHRFSISPQDPVRVSAKVSWKDGVIRILEGMLLVQNDMARADGTIDIINKKIRLKGSAKNFPAEFIFDKFQNPKFHRIFGKSDVTADFAGWGKNFEVKVQATTLNGGYQPMVAERVETKLKSTYNRMDMDWNIFEGDKSTGNASLIVHFGKKIKGEPRPKRIDLKVNVDGHPLASLFPDWGISGLGSGNLTLSGPHLNFHGKSHIEIVDGKWLTAAFDKAKADLDISRRKITFDNMVVKPRKLDPIVFQEPLIMDISPGAVRVHGRPTPKWDLDVGYQYAGRRWQIRKLTYIDSEDVGRRVDVSGSVVTGGAINLKADGTFDLSAFVPLGFLVREASGPVNLSLKIGGSIKNPSANGLMELGKCVFSPRFVRLPLENVQGKIRFNGRQVNFENITGYVDDGRFDLKGKVTHGGLQVTSADVTLSGKNLMFRTEDKTFRMEFEGSMTLAGKFPSPSLSGDITILDGKYTKDFSLLEAVTKKKKKLPSIVTSKDITFNPHLDLHIRNSGDLFVRNNVGDIGLRADLYIKGTRKKPLVGGAVEVTEGEVHYMGLEFDISRGFIEFREKVDNPYLEVVAEKEINIYNVTLEVHGDINNLSIDLSATSPTGPLDKKDIISLIAFGMTEREREEIAAQKGEQFGIAMAAQQLTHVIERPVKKWAHLDTFRLEASDPTSHSISRVAVGKHVSDRLHVHFTTDINTKDAVQTFVAEYLFTDNLLIKGSRSTDGRYEMGGVLRFRLR